MVSEEINGNKHLMLVPNNESTEMTKKYEELWSKITNQNKTMTNNSNDYEEKYIKIKLNSDDDLPPNKTLGFYNMNIFVRAIGIFQIKDLSCNKMSVMDATIY